MTAPTPGKLTRFKATTSKIWQLSLPYFQSDEKWKARALLAAIVVLNLAAVYMLVLLNEWNRLFYDALQNKDQAVFWQQLGRFAYLAFAFIVIAVYKFYLTQLLEVRWRAWMTAQYLQRWLGHHAFYRMELARFEGRSATPGGSASPDNPDQRIQEDVNQFTSYTVSLSMGLLNAVVTLASFVGILWGLSGDFSFSLGGHDVTIPGFMVWMAVLYCALGSLITHFVGKPQIALNYAQQRLEADFRHHLVRVREHSEPIALDRGEQVEGQQLNLRFGHVLRNYLALIRAQKRLVWFTSFFGQAAVIFPFIVAAPRFFSGAIQLGELMQIASAFDRVQGALSWFVENYSTLASWRATADRLTHFEDALARHEASLSPTVETTTSPDGSLQLRDLALALPQGTRLARASLQARTGDRILVSGPSGSGKSTLFRAIAGIWPHASGGLALPAHFRDEAMFIPQQPYLPQGPLRDALAYPEPASRYTEEALAQALRDALLPHLVHRLDEDGAWGQRLSGGERQRLAIARVLLKQPRWVFADEATSALDAPAEQAVYDKLSALVQRRNGALVSIAHRPGVAAFHTRQWALEKRPPGQDSAYTIRAQTLAPSKNPPA
jgi:putative ATP-binding cassette transporter